MNWMQIWKIDKQQKHYVWSTEKKLLTHSYEDQKKHIDVY